MTSEITALLTDPNAWAALITLTAMEIVLGIDNVVFIGVLVAKLPVEQAERARKLGLAMALIFRVIMLFMLSWLVGLTEPVVTFAGLSLSWRDLILIAGGAFLIYKATMELHHEAEPEDDVGVAKKIPASFGAAVAQIAVVDMVFSIDSIITAIGMAQQIPVMVAAVLISVAIMYLASGAVMRFIKAHPTAKVLALAFLILIGVSLTADGFGYHFPRGYLYAAMAFSALVEGLNIFIRNRRRKA